MKPYKDQDGRVVKIYMRPDAWYFMVPLAVLVVLAAYSCAIQVL